MEVVGCGKAKMEKANGHIAQEHDSRIGLYACDGSNQSDPHTSLTCAVAAPGSTEAAWGETLPIGYLPKPREPDTVKRRFPPFHGEEDGIRSWRSREPTGGQKRRTREEDDPEDVETPLLESEPELGSRTMETRCRDEDRWPRGAHE
ncbi:hypothetical protein NDU88_001031 [Pleurodeles waltl]|uniref:Uncharacterized protein n=1 Tax=Pleurodeles waltl TaxID=8319 RepID=A0AAV7P5U3_PLEWA|nr:hypothetical protein NDU88_001031 [Pleurodeles waltl]